MAKQINIFKERITRFHIIQSLLAGIYILIVFFVMHSLQSNLAVASLGASAFIAFSFPHKHSSCPRFLIGGYCVGTVCGLVCNVLNSQFIRHLPVPSYIPACALAVFMAMLLMTVLNFEHPPSAALSVAITIDSGPVTLGFAGLGCIITLCVLKKLLKKYMRDL